MKEKMILNNNLREKREAMGYSAEYVGLQTGCSEQTIKAIEHNLYVPSGYVCACLCVFFDCKFEELFFLDVVEVEEKKPFWALFK